MKQNTGGIYRTAELFDRLEVYFDFSLICLTLLLFVARFIPALPNVDIALAVLATLGLLPVLLSAIRSLLKKELTIDLLAAVALISSLLTSEWVPAAFITLMLAFARLFDHWTEAKTKSIITHLMKYKPATVKVRRGEGVVEVPLSHVKVGDLVIIESGDRVPVDGDIVSGEAALNEASLTGESELVPKKKGDKVLTSTLVESGSLLVRADKVGEDTTLERIIGLVEGASRKRAKTERIAGHFTRWYILLTILGSVLLYFLGIPPKTILAVLLVVCADDIAVAVPLGFTAAIAHAARRGVVIKGSDALEKIAKVKYFVTDKTGTLTYGRPVITDCRTFGHLNKAEVIKRFAIGASSSHHAVSRAILAEAQKEGIEIHAPEEFEETPGEGISFVHDGEHSISGRLSFLKQKGVEIPPEAEALVEEEKSKGNGIAALAVKGKLCGLISYKDELRHEAAKAIAESKELGVREWHMLTGDNESVAREVSKTVGIKHFKSSITPHGKVSYVESLKKEKHGVIAMIGDGVNDAASLALADVSIAMGAGTDAAIEAADISLVHDDLSRLPETIKLAQMTMRVIRQNFGIWVVTNASGLILVFMGVLGPAGAATFNFLTDFIPILNAIRLFGGRQSLSNRRSHIK
jgi:Cd2+/Zn2+-exporting ATPase